MGKLRVVWKAKSMKPKEKATAKKKMLTDDKRKRSNPFLPPLSDVVHVAVLFGFPLVAFVSELSLVQTTTKSLTMMNGLFGSKLEFLLKLSSALHVVRPLTGTRTVHHDDAGTRFRGDWIRRGDFWI